MYRSYDIKPKPTTYRHIEFKSKLEAKIALLLDCLSVHWIYEPKRFFIKELNCQYVPDFFINGSNIPGMEDIEMYLEIKPSKPTDVEVKKLEGVKKLTDIKCGFQVGFPDKFLHLMMNGFHPNDDIHYGEINSCILFELYHYYGGVHFVEESLDIVNGYNFENESSNPGHDTRMYFLHTKIRSLGRERHDEFKQILNSKGYYSCINKYLLCEYCTLVNPSVSYVVLEKCEKCNEFYEEHMKKCPCILFDSGVNVYD